MQTGLCLVQQAEPEIRGVARQSREQKSFTALPADAASGNCPDTRCPDQQRKKMSSTSESPAMENDPLASHDECSSLGKSLLHHLHYSLAKDKYSATQHDYYSALVQACAKD